MIFDEQNSEEIWYKCPEFVHQTWKMSLLYLIKCRAHAPDRSCIASLKNPSKNGWFLNGNLHFRQAALEELLKVSVFWVDTWFTTTPPIICIIHCVLSEFRDVASILHLCLKAASCLPNALPWSHCGLMGQRLGLSLSLGLETSPWC